MGHGDIAKRAYTIWEIEGRPSGRALDHWLRAEAEVQAEVTKSMPAAPTKAERPEITVAPPVKTQRAAARRTRRTQ